MFSEKEVTSVLDGLHKVVEAHFFERMPSCMEACHYDKVLGQAFDLYSLQYAEAGPLLLGFQLYASAFLPV